MSVYWYQNPVILFTNFSEFYPKQNFTLIQKVNSIARFAIYYYIIAIYFNFDSKNIILSICLLLLSYFLSISNNLQKVITKNNTNQCTRPTLNNPFMNFTVADQILNPNKQIACPINDKNIRLEEITQFRANTVLDPTDLYGKLISDRNFYTMPSTTVTNDQNGFAKFLFDGCSKCKLDGKNCLKYKNNKYHRGRLYYNNK